MLESALSSAGANIALSLQRNVPIVVTIILIYDHNTYDLKASLHSSSCVDPSRDAHTWRFGHTPALLQLPSHGIVA